MNHAKEFDSSLLLERCYILVKHGPLRGSYDSMRCGDYDASPLGWGTVWQCSLVQWEWCAGDHSPMSELFSAESPLGCTRMAHEDLVPDALLFVGQRAMADSGQDGSMYQLEGKVRCVTHLCFWLTVWPLRGSGIL